MSSLMDTKILELFGVEVMKQAIKQISEGFVKRNIGKMLEKRKLRRNVEENVFLLKFEEYLLNSFNEYNYINTIVFNNEQKKIEDLYMPLTIHSKNEGVESFVVDSYLDELVSKFKKILIIDTAGMGKSTIMKWMFLSCIQKKSGIPVFIELRKLSNQNTIIDEIFNKLNPINDEFDKVFIKELIKRGDFVFFLDGFDEIPYQYVDKVTKDIQDFINKCGNNMFILSSRPEKSLASFGNFMSFHIKKLEKEEAYTLLRKFDNDKMRYSETLIEKLEQNETYTQIQDFLENPLMVSLLYKGFEYKPIIPYKKHVFYRNVYDALFEDHDLSKGDSFVRHKKSNLDIEEFHRILRMLGFLSLQENEIEFEKDKLLTLITKSIEKQLSKSVSASDFLNDLHTSVPLFVQIGSKIKWSHKSFMEYFAAKFIEIDSKEDQRNILLLLYNSERDYHNLLEIYHDIDYPNFEKTILYQIACDFSEYCDNSYKNFELYPEKEVNLRKEVTYKKNYFLFKGTMKEVRKTHRLKELHDNYGINSLRYDGKFLIGCKDSNNYDKFESILSILFKRNSDLVKKPFIQKKGKDRYKEIKNLLLLNPEIEIDDNKDNILNSSEHFSLVTNLLFKSSSFHFEEPILNLKEVFLLKEKIDRNRIANNETDLTRGL